MNFRLSSGVLSIGLLVVSVALAHAQGFTTNANGFTGPGGQAWNAHGVNVDLTDAMQNLQGIEKNYPGTTFVRIVSYADKDTVANIAPVVQAYTSKGIAVELEDHGDSQGGANTGWYNSLAGAFKSNPLVLLETPNEPSGSAQSVSQAQISVIQAIRAAGFTNPIGVQPICCEDQSNIPLVTAAVGTSQLYVTPHIYGSPWQQSQIDEAKANGLPTIVDEFGNATDGQNIDAQGQATVDGVIAANQAGLAGAAIWAAGNGYHPDGSDSLFTDQTGSGLTSLGQDVQSWLSGTNTTPPSTTIASSQQTAAGPALAPSSAPVANANIPAAGPAPACSDPSSTTTPSTPPPPGSITPGSGSVTANGNTYMIDTANNEVMNNGSPATPNGSGAQTSAVTIIDGVVYGQDENTTQWFQLQPGGTGWTPLQSLPTSGQAIAPTSRWSTPPSPATAQGIAASDGAAATVQQSQSLMVQQQSILCELQVSLGRLIATQASQRRQ